jgi:hypothetical protein
MKTPIIEIANFKSETDGRNKRNDKTRETLRIRHNPIGVCFLFFLSECMRQKSGTNEFIEQKLVFADADEKKRRLLQSLKEVGPGGLALVRVSKK